MFAKCSYICLMGQNRVFYDNIGLSDMHDFLLGIFYIHGSVPEPAVRTGTSSTSRDRTHRVFFVCILLVLVPPVFFLHDM
jgi:hypothetical protein